MGCFQNEILVTPDESLLLLRWIPPQHKNNRLFLLTELFENSIRKGFPHILIKSKGMPKGRM